MAKLLVKIGNSEISALKGSRIHRFPSEEASLKRLLKLSASSAIVFASVVPELSKKLKGLCNKGNYECAEIRTKDIPFQFAYSKTLGVDRALNIYAGSISLKRAASIPLKRSFGVLDLGTAITFDFVNTKSQHEGGWILAGPKLQALALSLGTAQLPKIVIKKNKSRSLGRSTRQCLEVGILQNLFAIVEGARAFCRERRAQLIVTGGWTRLLKDQRDLKIERALSLKGIAAFVQSVD